MASAVGVPALFTRFPGLHVVWLVQEVTDVPACVWSWYVLEGQSSISVSTLVVHAVFTYFPGAADAHAVQDPPVNALED